jgi:adenylate cyclase
MRRVWTPAIAVSLLGFAVGMAYRYAFDDPNEATVANYLRSGVHGMGLALVGWTVHLYFNSHNSEWLRRSPALVEIAVRAFAMAIILSIVALGLQGILYDQPFEVQWLIAGFPRIIAIALIFSALVSTAFELTRLIGGRVLVNIILARYRRPAREDRVLMFVDLVGSTSLAEVMGELRVHEFLTRFFFDIDEPIVAHGGEVHTYVGDEVIVTWPLGVQVSQGCCFDCFFAIEDKIASRAGSYQQQFGAVPRVRAGLHAGPVIISECGNSRRQIAYFGDTVNVAARLQEYCKEVSRDLIVSANVLRYVEIGSNVTMEPLGPVTLRGRSAAVELFAVRRNGHRWFPATRSRRQSG